MHVHILVLYTKFRYVRGAARGKRTSLVTKSNKVVDDHADARIETFTVLRILVLLCCQPYARAATVTMAPPTQNHKLLEFHICTLESQHACRYEVSHGAARLHASFASFPASFFDIASFAAQLLVRTVSRFV